MRFSVSAPLGIVLCQIPNNDVDAAARNGYRYIFAPPSFLPDRLPANVLLGEAGPGEDGPLYGEMTLLCHDDATGKEVRGPACSRIASIEA